MITDSNSSISLFTGFLHVNIVAHHRLQSIVEQCIKYLIHASAIRDFKLVIALVLYIIHMASDSGTDTGRILGGGDIYEIVTHTRYLSSRYGDACKRHEEPVSAYHLKELCLVDIFWIDTVIVYDRAETRA